MSGSMVQGAVNPVDIHGGEMCESVADPAGAMLAAAMFALAAGPGGAVKGSVQSPVRIDLMDLALEGGTDPAFGSVRWRTLFCADRTPTAGVVMGVAEFAPGGTLLPHRHPPAEVYFGLAGSATVTVDGVAHLMGPGTALFIPGDAEHGTLAGPDGFRLLYVFPQDRFSDVDYHFSPI